MGDRAAFPVSSARVRSQGDDKGGVEAAVHVPLSGGDQPITGLDVFQRAGLAVRLATFKVPGLAGHVQFDGLAVLVRDGDHVTADSNDLPGNMRPAEVDSRRIEFAVARFEPYADMAVDFDRGPAGGLVAAADDLGLVGAHERFALSIHVSDRQLRLVDGGHGSAEHIPMDRLWLCIRAGGRRSSRRGEGSRGERSGENSGGDDSSKQFPEHSRTTSLGRMMSTVFSLAWTA